MIITKQDLQNIANRLAKLGIRDTQFPKVSSVDGSTLVPVIQDNKNYTATLMTLVSYMVSNIAASSITVSSTDLTANNLADALDELVDMIGNGGGGGIVPTTVTARQIRYNFSEFGYSADNVSDTLSCITAVLRTIFSSIATATDEEIINNVINS